MLHWFPRIKDILPVPRTTFYVLTDAQVYEIIGLLDGKDLPDDLKNALLRAANQIGYPLFLRTDMGSAKHDYERSCCLMREAGPCKHPAPMEGQECIGFSPDKSHFRRKTRRGGA